MSLCVKWVRVLMSGHNTQQYMPRATMRARRQSQNIRVCVSLFYICIHVCDFVCDMGVCADVGAQYAAIHATRDYACPPLE